MTDILESLSVAGQALLSANARQVGGAHYAAEYQHWDYVADLNLDYYQACASKYVLRAFKKNGLEDLEKAPHYIQKRQELQDDNRADAIDREDLGWVADRTFILGQCNGLTVEQTAAIYWIAAGDWEKATHAIEAITTKVKKSLSE